MNLRSYMLCHFHTSQYRNDYGNINEHSSSQQLTLDGCQVEVRRMKDDMLHLRISVEENHGSFVYFTIDFFCANVTLYEDFQENIEAMLDYRLPDHHHH